MFNNIGGKIKILAVVFTVIGIIISVALVIYFWYGKAIAAGFIVLIGGCLLSWLGSFLLYGFGEMIFQTTRAANGIEDLKYIVFQNSSTPKACEKVKCPYCSGEVNADAEECPICGHKLK